jgi:molecular chaperone GrpE
MNRNITGEDELAPGKKSHEAEPERVKKKSEHKKSAKLSRKKLEEVEEKARRSDEYLDQLLRLKAEFENYRKRMNREREEFAKFAMQELVSDLLTVIDNLENALLASEKTEDFRALHEGVEMTRKEALRILGQWGLEEVQAVGERFDPEKHEAVMHVDSDEEEDRIVEELRKGYSLKGRLIRPSMVKVAGRSENG